MVSLVDQIREAKERVERQCDIVLRVKRNGMNPTEAEALLRHLVLALEQLERASRELPKASDSKNGTY